MPRPTFSAALAALLVLACRPEHEKPTTSITTSESSSTGVGGFSSTGAPTTTGASTTTGAPTTTGASSSLDIDDTGASDGSGSSTPTGFIIPPDDPDPLVCDCPEGQLCVRSVGIDSWFIVCALPPAGCDPADVCTPACATACYLPPPLPENCDGREPPEWLECGNNSGFECSTWTGNCPAGEKCVVFPIRQHMDCQAIDAAPAAIGEPCTGPSDVDVDAPDTCVAGAGCFGVDPVTKQPVCAAFCTGTPADPGCPPDTACQVDPESLVAICVPT
jgi:hypothetical protein